MSEELPYDFSNCDMKTIGYEKTGRKSGFYWCKLSDNHQWEVYYYNEFIDIWYGTGCVDYFMDSYFLEIDERPIVREEDNTELSDTCKYCGKPLPNDDDERYYHQNNECQASGKNRTG